jgi:DNA-binding transcriptional LysR family regulator
VGSLELRQLRYFVAVAEELHFGRAALRLHMTQPPLSQQIHNLEREVGTLLLQRDKRHVELTDAGRAFLEHARRALAEAEEAKTSAMQAASGTLGRLFIGCNAYARWWAPVDTILDNIAERFPAIRVQLSYAASGALLRQLRVGQLDMALVLGPTRDSELEYLKITSEPYFVALPESHRLAMRRSVRIEDLAGETLLLFARRVAPDQHDEQLAMFRDAGVPVDVTEVPAESTGLLGGVAAGLGFGLLPSPKHPYPGTVQLRLGPPPRNVDLNLVWPRRRRGPVVQSVIRLVKELAIEGRLGASA